MVTKIKKIKQILLVFLTVCVIMCNVLAFAAVATALSQDESFVQNELSPYMASDCDSYVKFDTSMADKVAKYHGYAGAEALKKDFGLTSNANMYRNSSTGEIVLITDTGAKISTDLYGGW